MEPRLPPDLRLLKTLVTILTGVMIAGLIAVVALLVTRLPGARVTAPDALVLPPDTAVVAVTQTPAYWLVTTRDNRALIFAPDGTFRREIALD
ncbi:DUF6476 family protein [Jannaschia sp. S6380]|uniref:DUF6476 family protein n=1 Tax=Jannaschia sp. S6380 TaxID=2926408 RepID=UPI001FF2A477|nr:DUF6476 family protein [Jannaschia sp. S6380]MCK0167600.1 DUF6476 family protein [Jannaschia sp. S6380]